MEAFLILANFSAMMAMLIWSRREEKRKEKKMEVSGFFSYIVSLKDTIR